MKIVTVGTSKICSLLIEAFKMANVEVFACVGRDATKTEEFARANNVSYNANDYDAVLTSDIFDTVYLALPNHLHYSYAKKALLAGKNVICEKPMCSNLEEAKDLVLLANSQKCFLFDATTTLHNLAFKQLKDDIKKIGRIRTVNVDFYKYSSKYDRFKNGEVTSAFNPEMSGGALMDLGVYNLSLIIGLFGLPKAVKYFPNIEKGIDTSGVAILKYDDFIVNSVNGKDANGGSGFSIRGEEGYIESNQVVSKFTDYRICLNDGTVKERNFDSRNQYLDEINDFKLMYDYKNYRKANDYLMLTLHNMKILDELRKSAGIEIIGEK